MKESSAESALWEVLTDANVSLPLGSTDRELIRLAKDSGPGVPWTAVVRLCGSMESKERVEDVLEISGETTWSLPPQETMWVAIDEEEEMLRDNKGVSSLASLALIRPMSRRGSRSHVAVKFGIRIMATL